MTPEIKNRIEKIGRGEVPKGYKKTKAGILPTGWNVYILGDCLRRIERPVEVKPNKLYTQIGIRSHGKGLFYKEPVAGAMLGNKSVFWMEPDCFILNIVFAWEQAIGKTTQSEVGMIGSLIWIRPQKLCGAADKKLHLCGAKCRTAISVIIADCRSVLLNVTKSPLSHLIKNGEQIMSHFCQRVFHVWWNLVVLYSGY